MQRLEHIKLQLRQQSGGHNSENLPEEHLEALSLSPEQAVSAFCSVPTATAGWVVSFQTLKLCQAVHRLHFQLLVLLGSYVKLLHSLQPHLVTSGVSYSSVFII